MTIRVMIEHTEPAANGRIQVRQEWETAVPGENDSPVNHRDTVLAPGERRQFHVYHGSKLVIEEVP